MTNNFSLQDVRQTKEYAGFMKKMGWEVNNVAMKSRRKSRGSSIEASGQCNPDENEYHFVEDLRWSLDTLDSSRVIGPRSKHRDNETIYIYIKKPLFIPFSVAKILRCKKPPSQQKLKQISKKHKIISIKLQPFATSGKDISEASAVSPSAVSSGPNCSAESVAPQNAGTPPRWRIDHHPLTPTKTIWIDLKKTEKQLLREMKKKVRYSINFSKRKGVKAKVVSGDKITKKQLNDFYKVWSKNKPFNLFFKPNFNELKYLVESFGNKCFFVFAFTNHQSPITNHQISGVLILNSSNIAFDWLGANTLKGRKLLAKPLVLWQAIKESKKRGLRIFDFEGIYDKRFPKLNKGWIGFSNFKKGFGGKEIEFSQPLIKLLPGWT